MSTGRCNHIYTSHINLHIHTLWWRDSNAWRPWPERSNPATKKIQSESFVCLLSTTYVLPLWSGMKFVQELLSSGAAWDRQRRDRGGGWRVEQSMKTSPPAGQRKHRTTISFRCKADLKESQEKKMTGKTHSITDLNNAAVRLLHLWALR